MLHYADGAYTVTDDPEVEPEAGERAWWEHEPGCPWLRGEEICSCKEER